MVLFYRLVLDTGLGYPRIGDVGVDKHLSGE